MVQQSIEPEGGAIDTGYIRSRVDDWASRVEALYDDLSAWLPTLAIYQIDVVSLTAAGVL